MFVWDNKSIENKGKGLNEQQIFKFDLTDIKFISLTPLDLEHKKVNGYANAWYIDPAIVKSGTSFSFVLLYYALHLKSHLMLEF